MTATILDGKKLSKISEQSIKQKVENLSEKVLSQPWLQFLLAMILPLRLM